MSYFAIFCCGFVGGRLFAKRLIHLLLKNMKIMTNLTIHVINVIVDRKVEVMLFQINKNYEILP